MTIRLKPSKQAYRNIQKGDTRNEIDTLLAALQPCNNSILFSIVVDNSGRLGSARRVAVFKLTRFEIQQYHYHTETRPLYVATRSGRDPNSLPLFSSAISSTPVDNVMYNAVQSCLICVDDLYRQSSAITLNGNGLRDELPSRIPYPLIQII